jgi:Protein of unknown function (DUF2911)
MKRICSILLFCTLFSITAIGQDAQIIPPIDKSPMDMSTYPPNYPLLKTQDKTKEQLVARITYSRPQKSNRIIFGELVEYNAVWRFGANENTEIEFFKDVKVNKTIVKKGKYSVFAIPKADKWTIILNKDLNTWGSFKYDKTKDLLRVDVNVQKSTAISDIFYIYFDKTTTGFSLNAGWDDVKVTLPINM